eukprot:2727789-Amphidinium_carterae.1
MQTPEDKNKYVFLHSSFVMLVWEPLGRGLNSGLFHWDLLLKNVQSILLLFCPPMRMHRGIGNGQDGFCTCRPAA